MSDYSRLVAVADLLLDEGRFRDPGAIAAGAAEQVARLTRAGQARVRLVGPDGAVARCYPAHPRAEAAAVLEASVEAAGTAGLISLAEPVDGGFTELDGWLLDIVARRVESQLSCLDFRNAELAAREVVRDAEVAGELQRALVSAEKLRTRTARAAGDLRPARRVGGDLFDLLEADGELVAVVADVSGKGAPASLLTSALLSSVQHHVVALGPHPGRLLGAVGASIDGMLDRTGRIVTLAIAATDSATGKVRVASAGHHPVFIRSAGEVHPITPTCPPLGVVPPRSAEHVEDFVGDAAVLLASDGLVDQCDPAGEAFGMDRLGKAFAEAPGEEPATLVAGLLRTVRRHARHTPQDDDRAAVVVMAEEGR